MMGMRPLAVLAILAGVLAGCQPIDNGKLQTSVEADVLARAMASHSEDEEYTPTEPFKGKAEELGLQLLEKLLTKCIRSSGIEDTYACYHERMMAGFDSDGTVADHCPQQADMEADMKCIVIGGFAYQLATKMGGDAKAKFDWSDPEGSMKELGVQFVLREARNCLNNGSASDPMDCIVARMAAAMELTSSDLDPCKSLADEDSKFGQCIGEAFSYKYLSAAVARM
jgi:hypothetical protein